VNDVDVTFPCMGCDVRLIVGGPGADAAVADARSFLAGVDTRLSRFRPGSELCALNADPRDRVPASALLRTAVRAGRWAAERTGGLVTPVVVDALEAAGYDRSLAGAAPAPLAAALAWAPPRRPAAPDPAAPWRAVSVDDAAGVVRRPPGLRLDTGGTGKGLAADALAHRLRGRERAVVDCGGDVRVCGPAAAARPLRVEVAHPLGGGSAHVLHLRGGAVATSGIDVRLWRDRHGGYAHHLLDPSTGRPAWTGLVAVTALAPTALEAETLSKAALLSGPAGARRLLRDGGGVLVHDGGEVEPLGPARARGRVRVRLAEAA
jgi:thiamine biosynthesis lipoprotein